MEIESEILSSAAAIADLYGWIFLSNCGLRTRFTKKKNAYSYCEVVFNPSKNRVEVIFGDSLRWTMTLTLDDLICFERISKVIEEYCRQRGSENGSDSETDR